MSKPRLFVCNKAKVDEKEANGRLLKELGTIGHDKNVFINIEDVSKIFLKHLTPRLVDFLEIASFVYAADASTLRKGVWKDEQTTESWDRDFRFVISVRDVEFWNQDEVQSLLSKTLLFLSDDTYEFTFQKLVRDRHIQEYLEFGNNLDWPFYDVDRVLLFSGGLDSLAGAVVTASEGSKLVLVSHRPVAKLSKRQINLFSKLQNTFQTPMIHIPVWINKDKKLGREYTQRTRSFLYCVLGTVVAESLRAKGISFFENGIVSLNWPIADEVLRARASRTTHPHSLYLFKQLCSLVLEREFEVDNPFIFKTKAEVVALIAERKASHLISYTSSCAHSGHFQSKTRWHCGTCTQCIDRRIAIIDCGLEKYDEHTDYVSDVFIGPREKGYQKNMAVNFVRHANELKLLTEDEIATKFNLDLTRAIRFFPQKRQAANKFIKMHQIHADTVHRVITQQIQINASKLIEGDLDDSSMLAIVVGQEHLESTWIRYSNKVAHLLQTGLPVACEKHKPNDEPHLQQICDGILKTHDLDLIREFPYMRWASSLTKPDWSSESLSIWVEAKYVRKKSDIYKITDAIAADITKYGDNDRRVQFIIYDPDHLILDEKEFNEPIEKRDWLRADFIR